MLQSSHLSSGAFIRYSSRSCLSIYRLHGYPDVLSHNVVPSWLIVQYRLFSCRSTQPSHLFRSSVNSYRRNYHTLRPDWSDILITRFLRDFFPFVSSFVIPPTRPHVSSPRLCIKEKGKEAQRLLHGLSFLPLP